tara:strand:- start:1398 stop:2183 length:786 start_codon:yes stop_codon:yes gene_type:complete
MRILITGKNGYVGSSLLSKLDSLFDFTYPNFYIGVGREDFDLTNREETTNFLSKYGYFDVIIHTAICGGSRLKEDDNDVLANNIKMFYNLMANVNKFGQLISLGSGAELNWPSDPYGLSKSIIADIIDSHSKLNNIRIFGVFDENEWGTRFIKTCLNNYKNRKPMTIHQNKLFDFIYMDDLVVIIKYIILNPSIKVIDACYRESYTLKEIADYINTRNNHHCEVKIENKKLGKPYTGNFKNYNLDLIGLKQGINKVYDATN